MILSSSSFVDIQDHLIYSNVFSFKVHLFYHTCGSDLLLVLRIQRKSIIDIKGETCFRIYNGEFLLSSFKSICLCTTSVQEIFFHTNYSMNHVDSSFQSNDVCFIYLKKMSLSLVGYIQSCERLRNTNFIRFYR